MQEIKNFRIQSKLSFNLSANTAILLLITAILILLLGACQTDKAASNTTGAAPRPISVCTSAESPLQLPVWYAYEKGLFNRYGLQAKNVRLSHGSTAATTMLAGEVDACQIAAGSHSDIMGALTSGAVDRAIQGVPLLIKSQEAGFRELLDISSLPYPYQHLAIATSRTFLKERPEDGLNLMHAITDAVHEMQRDPEGTKEVLAQYLALDPQADANLLEETYQVVIKQQIEAVPNVSKDGVLSLIDIAAQDNPNARGLDFADVVDTSIMETLNTSGFLESLER